MVIVIPVFEEAPSIAGVVVAARRHGPVLVVDDGSRDASAAAARAAGAEVIRHERRRGKGQALRTGMAAARARGAVSIVTLDGDGQHDPDDVPLLLAAAAEFPRAIIVGNRLPTGAAAEAGRAGLTPDRLNAIRLAGFFVNWISGLRLSDTQSGFRVYPVALLDAVRTRRGGFVFETEILVAAAAQGWDAREVAVRSRARSRHASRFRPLADGLAVGAYLAARVAARWASEIAAAARAVTSVFGRERMRARHAAILEAAAPYADSFGAWGWACGAMTGRRVVDWMSARWRGPRRRRATVVAWATAVSPMVLALLLLQTLLGRRMPDVVSPLVAALYSQERLDQGGTAVAAAPPLTARPPAAVGHHAAATPPSPRP